MKRSRADYDRRRYIGELMNRPELAEAREQFELAFRYSREHSKQVDDACKKYGDHGPQISGVIRDHFPDDVKEQLRLLCWLMNTANEGAYKMKPKGMHRTTFYRFRDAIRERVGTGFYL